MYLKRIITCRDFAFILHKFSTDIAVFVWYWAFGERFELLTCPAQSEMTID